MSHIEKQPKVNDAYREGYDQIDWGKKEPEPSTCCMGFAAAHEPGSCGVCGCCKAPPLR